MSLQSFILVLLSVGSSITCYLVATKRNAPVRKATILGFLVGIFATAYAFLAKPAMPKADRSEAKGVRGWLLGLVVYLAWLFASTLFVSAYAAYLAMSTDGIDQQADYMADLAVFGAMNILASLVIWATFYMKIISFKTSVVAIFVVNAIYLVSVYYLPDSYAFERPNESGLFTTLMMISIPYVLLSDRVNNTFKADVSGSA